MGCHPTLYALRESDRTCVEPPCTRERGNPSEGASGEGLQGNPQENPAVCVQSSAVPTAQAPNSNPKSYLTCTVVASRALLRSHAHTNSCWLAEGESKSTETSVQLKSFLENNLRWRTGFVFMKSPSKFSPWKKIYYGSCQRPQE